MTLIEVVVAIAIFGIVMVTVFPAIMVLNLINTFSFEQLDTSFIAQNVIEEVILISRDSSFESLANEMIQKGYTSKLVSTEPQEIVFIKESPSYDISVEFFQRNNSNLFDVIVLVKSNNPTINDAKTLLETIISLRTD